MKIDFEVSAEQHAATGRSQKQTFESIAAMIEAGVELSAIERKWAAGAIRAFAKAIPERKPSKGPGNPSKKLPAEIGVLYAINLVLHRMTKTASIAKLAADHGVDVSSVKKALGFAGQGAARSQKLARTNACIEWIRSEG